MVILPKLVRTNLKKNCEIDEISTSNPPVQLKTNVLQFKRDKVLEQITKAMDKASAPHRKS